MIKSNIYKKIVVLSIIFVMLLIAFDNVHYTKEAEASANTKQVDFAESTNQTQTKIITIPNLVSVDSIAVDTGNVTYSINGNNVEITVSNGSVTRQTSSQESAYRTSTRSSSSNSFPSSIPYNSGGFSGTLYKNGSSYSQTTTYGSKFVRQSENNMTCGSCFPPSIPYDDGTYQGTLYPDGNGVGYNGVSWFQYYEGTVYSQYTTWYQEYAGTVYGDTVYTNYYAYTVTLDYTDNAIPTINLTTSDNQLLSEVNNYNRLYVSGSVRDTDIGDNLLLKYTIDGNAAHTNQTLTTITANGSNQSFNIPITINSSIPQGTHTLRVWVEDDKGGRATDVTRSFRVDKTAPTLPTIVANTNWTNSNVPVSMTHGTDSGGAGVNRTEYQLNGATITGWTAYPGSFTISNEGSTTITARTIDNAGNVSSIRTATVRIDKTAPTLPTITANTNWINSNVPVSMTHGTDSGGSGVNRTEYQLTGATTIGWTTYSGSFAISNEGTTTITARTIDNAGNVFSNRTATVRIDKTAPTLPTIAANINWTNSNVPVSMTHGTDSGGSGVNRTEYQLNGATSVGWTTYPGSFTISSEGSTTITARTIDNAGNISSIRTATVRIDKTRPTISASPISREVWGTSEIDITVSVADDASGVSTRQYEVTSSSTPTNNWSTAATNNFSLKVDNEGEWYVHVRATDAAGNVENQTFGVYRYFNLQQAEDIRATSPKKDQLDIEWNQLDGYEYQVRLSEDDNNVVYTSDWGVSAPITVVDLKPNTKYTPEVNSRRYDIETGFKTGTFEFTDANPVKSATFTPQDRAIEITLNISSTDNPSGTKYMIKNMETNQVSLEIEETWLNTELLNDMRYTYMAKVMNRNGNESEWFLIGTGNTIMTEINVPGNWDDPVGGQTPIQIPEDYDPNNMEGKVVEFNGEVAYVVQGRYINIEIENVENARSYAVALEGFGYSEWKELDETGSFTESIFINTPGLYKVHIKFRNEYGGESPPFVHHYLVDWIAPDMKTEKKLKRQTATTTDRFTIVGKGQDNLSPVLYNTGSGWQIYEENEDMTVTGLTPGYNKITIRFGDYNGNITESEYEIWRLE